jgi:hypothetical protein
MNKELESIIEKEWEHTGLKCRVVFFRQSHRCGYVGVPKEHLAYNKNYDDLPIDVHGGLTYGAVKKDGLQWFGFNCAHSGDKTLSLSFEENGHLWTTEEVIEETEKMAEQFSRMTLRALVIHKLEYMPDWFKNSVQFIVKEGSTKQ